MGIYFKGVNFKECLPAPTWFHHLTIPAFPPPPPPRKPLTSLFHCSHASGAFVSGHRHIVCWCWIKLSFPWCHVSISTKKGARWKAQWRREVQGFLSKHCLPVTNPRGGGGGGGRGTPAVWIIIVQKMFAVCIYTLSFRNHCLEQQIADIQLANLPKSNVGSLDILPPPASQTMQGK